MYITVLNMLLFQLSNIQIPLNLGHHLYEFFFHSLSANNVFELFQANIHVYANKSLKIRPE